MLSVISPAKTLDFETAPATARHSKPAFLGEARKLVDELRELAPHQLSSLMSISDKLGELNFDRYQHWRGPFTPKNAKQALLAFRGDVYTGLDADGFDDADFAFAQDHLRILSGLYGLLRPLDLIRPYRLEMGTRFANARGANLYEFWGERITDALAQAITESGSPVLVNLASNEYFRAVHPGRLEGRLITPVFKDYKGGKFKVVSFYAKKARGLMAAWLIRQRADEPEAIRDFNAAGYRYDKKLSNSSEWVFTRREPA